MFIPFLFDVADETAVQLAAERVDQYLKSARLGGLVNNAGFDCFVALSQ
jgi:NAD(P)-dependent dehydrogenase (short-subunit alcohol dehydrogenase family)